jgi:hypothetical protein
MKWALVSGVVAVLAGCKDEGPPQPRWVHKPSEIDRTTWGRDCGGGEVPARYARSINGTSDLWHVNGPPGSRLSVLCSMDWSDDASRIEFVGVTAGQRGTLDPSLTAAAFRRAVPVVMRELPAEVQAQVRLLVDNAAQGVLRTRVLGFTIRRGLLEDSTQAEMQLYVFWDPERIQ